MSVFKSDTLNIHVCMKVYEISNGRGWRGCVGGGRDVRTGVCAKRPVIN